MEPMKEQITKDFVEVCRRYQLPDEKINQIQEALATILGAEDDSLSLAEVFPDLHPGSAIQGFEAAGGPDSGATCRTAGN